MKRIAINFFKFLQNPQEKFEETLSNNQKWELFFTILLIDFTLVFIFSGIGSFIDSNLFELDSKSIENIFDDKGVIQILLISSLFVPFIEELIFRFPLKYQRNLLFHFFNYFFKNSMEVFWSRNFKIIFYL